MSKNIETNVVEMQFDNSKFERNVKESMSTLDKLKSALNFSSSSKSLKELEKATNNVDFSGMTNGVQSITAKFSALEVIGVTALMNITNRAIDAGLALTKSLSIDQITAGWSKYGEKMASVQTIMNATGKSVEEVSSYLEELMWFSDETSYGFNDMTSALATMTASGGEIEKLIPMITGVANATAFAGKGASEFSRVMYNINQSYSQGYLSLMDWRSVQNANVASKQLMETLISSAEELGKIEKGEVTISNFTDTLKNKWADTKVMEKAFGVFSEMSQEAYKLVEAGQFDTASEAMEYLSGKYSELGERAFKAAQEAKTFEEAIDATKDAVSSKWSQIFEVLFGNFEEAKETWTELANTLWDIFAGPLDNVVDKLEGAFDPSGYDNFTGYLEEAGVELGVFEESLIKVAKKNGLVTDSLIESGDALQYILDHGLFTGDLISEALASLIGDVEEFGEATVDVGDHLSYFQKMVDEVWRGDWGDGHDRVVALTEAGHNYAAIQSLVNKTVDGHRLSIEEVTEAVEEYGYSVNQLSDSQLENIGFTKEQIESIHKLAEEAGNADSTLGELIKKASRPSGRELFIDSFRNALKGLQEIIEVFGKSWHNIFPESTSETIYKLVEKFHELSELLVPSNWDKYDHTFNKFSSTLYKIEKTLTGVFAAIDIIRMVIGGGLKAAINGIKTVLGGTNFNLLQFTANIGDNIVAFRDWLKEGSKVESFFNNIGGAIYKGITYVRDWVNSIWNLESVQKIVIKVQTVFNNFVKKIKDEFSGTTKVFKDFIDRVKQLDGFTLENIIAVLKDFWDNVVGYFFDFNKIQSTFIEKWEEIKLKIKNALGSVGDYLDTCKEKIHDFVGAFSEKIDTHKGAIAAVIFGGLLFSIYKSLKKITGIGTLIKNIVNPLSSLSKVFDTLSATIKSAQLLIIAGAIVILAGAIAILAKLSWEDLAKGIGTIVILFGALSGLLFLLNKLSPVLMKIDMTKIGLGFLAIAAAVWILVNALQRLNSIVLSEDWETKVYILVGILGALMTAVGLLGRYGGTFKSGILSIVGLAAGVWILIKAFEEILNFDFDEKDFMKALESLGVCVVALSALVLAAGFSGVGIGAGIGVLLVVASIRAMIKLFEELMSLNIEQSKVEETLENFRGVLFAFVGLMALTQLAGANAGKAGAMIFAIGASILMIVAAIKILEGISSRGIAKGIIVLSTIMAFFTLLIKVSASAGQNAAKAGVMLLAASAAILILIGCIALIGLLNEDQLVRGVAVITALGLILAGLMYVSKYAASTKESMKTIIALTVAVGVMAIAIAVLAAFDPERIVTATLCLTLVMGMFAVLILAISKVVIDTSDIAALYAITGVVALLALIIGLLCGLGKNLDMALQAAGAISILLLAISASLLIISKIQKVSWQAIGALAVITLVVGGIALILGLLLNNTQNLDQAMTIANAITEVLLAMSIALLVCGMVGTLGPAALIGAGSLLAILIVFGAVALAVGDLADSTDMEKVIAGFEFMQAISSGIGGIIGAFAGGIISGFASALTNLGTMADELSDFMIRLTPFLVGAKMIDSESINNVANIASIITTLTGANILDGISKFFSGQSSLSKFGEELVPFGEDLILFATTIAPIKMYKESIEIAAEAMDSISVMASSIPNSGGALGWLVGNNDLGPFGENLSAFGESLIEFATSVNGLSDTSIISDSRTAASATDYMIELADKLPNNGGAIAWLVGENDIGTFGDHLKIFGEGILSFAESVIGLSDTNVVADAQVASEAASYVVEIANTLKNSNGVWQSIFGNGSDLSGFSEDLPGFGTAVKEYVDSLEGVANKKGDVIYTNTIVDTFVSMATNVSNIGKFGDKLIQFAEDIKSFADKFKEIEFGENFAAKVNSFCLGIQKLYSLDLESNFNTISAQAAGAIQRITDAIPNIGTDFSAGVSNVLSSCLKTALGYWRQFYNTGAWLVYYMNQGFVLQTYLTDGINKAVYDAQVYAYNSNIRRFWYTGNYFALAIINGWNSVSMASKMSNLVYNAQVYTYSNNINRFWYTGAYFVDGVINGMDSRAYNASLAGTRLANVIINATRKAFDEHSPSKEGEEIGVFFDLGVIGGVLKKASEAADAGKYLGEKTMSGLEAALKTANDIINNGIDDQPTIRPIIDLSDVEEGTKTLYASFGRNVGIGLTTTMRNVNSIVSSQSENDGDNSKNQNGKYGNNYSFVQNNYSPKSLSRVDIYRQTRNQFAAMERATKS